MIYTIIYFIIGILFAMYWWHRDYKDEYVTMKYMNEVEDGMAVLWIFGMVFLWPIKLIVELINYIRIL